MARSYSYWNDQRFNQKKLDNIPAITNVVKNTTGNNVRYYSSIDAEIYFGDRFIDEVTSIQFQVQQQTLPIYGYNSYTFDDIALGSRIVTGQFAINFTKNNYLTEVLEVLTAVSRKMYGKDTAQSSKFKDVERQRLNKPLWDRGFDIVVGYGDDGRKNTTFSSVITLNCVQITGCMQQLDSNGEPIQEVYSFMARDIKYSSGSSSTDNKVSKDPSNPDTIKELNINDAEFDMQSSKLKVSATTGEGITIKKVLFNFLDSKVLKNMPKIFRPLTASGSSFEYNLDDNKSTINMPTMKSEIEKYAKDNNITKVRVLYKIQYEKAGVAMTSSDIPFETKIKL